MSKVWVTRDKAFSDTITIWQGYTKPWKSYIDGVFLGELFSRVNKRNFKSLFGFTPRKGSCKQYELSLKEIK